MKNAEKNLTEKKVRLLNDTIGYRFLISLILAVIGLVGVTNIGENGMMTLTYLTKYAFWVVMAFACLSALALVYFIIKKSKGKDETNYIITSASLLGYALSGLGVSLTYLLPLISDVAYDSARIIPLILLPILFFIYHTFNSVFFVTSVECAIAYTALHLMSYDSLIIADKARLLIAGAAFVACIAVGIAAYFIVSRIKNDRDEKKLNLLVMTAIVIAALVVSALLPGAITYAMFTLVAAYLVIAVISTIDMM